MVCEKCHERPASVHITRIINNEKTEMYLCQECAREVQPQWDFSLPKFLASLLDYEPGFNFGIPQTERCEQCGLTYDQFHQTGRLGCPACYRYFTSRLEPLVHKIQGSTRHRGKVPRRGGGALRLEREIEILRTQLQELVAKEEFEKAAQLRDRIRDLEAKLTK